MGVYSFTRTLTKNVASDDSVSEPEEPVRIGKHEEPNTTKHTKTLNNLDGLFDNNTEILSLKALKSEKSHKDEHPAIHVSKSSFKNDVKVMKAKSQFKTQSKPNSPPKTVKKTKVVNILQKNYSQPSLPSTARIKTSTNFYKKSDEAYKAFTDRNNLKTSSCRDQFSRAIKNREPIIHPMFRTKGDFKSELKQKLPGIERSEGIINKYKQSIQFNRDILDESPALITKQLREYQKSKRIKIKSEKKVDNLLLTQRVEASRPRNTYLLDQNQEYNLSPGEMEIAKLMENKKDYDPNLIKNALLEQNHIRQLAKIIINLKEKGEKEEIRNMLPQKFTIESLLGVIEENFDQTLKDKKFEMSVKNPNEHHYPIKTNFEKDQDKQQYDFLNSG